VFQADPTRLATLDGLIDAMLLAARRQAWLEASKTDLVSASGNDIVVKLWEALARHVLIVFGREARTERAGPQLVEQHAPLARPTGGGGPANSAPPDRAAHPAPAAWLGQLRSLYEWRFWRPTLSTQFCGKSGAVADARTAGAAAAGKLGGAACSRILGSKASFSCVAKWRRSHPRLIRQQHRVTGAMVVQ
jgi:hypothetical protein